MPENFTTEPQRWSRERELLKNYWISRGDSPEDAERKALAAYPATGGAQAGGFPKAPPRTSTDILGEALGAAAETTAKSIPGAVRHFAEAFQPSKWRRPRSMSPVIPPQVAEFVGAARGAGAGRVPGEMGPPSPPIEETGQSMADQFRGAQAPPAAGGTSEAAEAEGPTAEERYPVTPEMMLAEKEARAAKSAEDAAKSEEEAAQKGELGRQSKIRNLRMVGGILEGIGGRGRSGTLAGRVGELEDELGPGEIKTLAGLGIPVSKGMRLSRLEKMFPGGRQNPLALALRERSLDQRDRALALGETSEGRRGESFRRLPDRDVRDLADKKDTLDAIDRVEAAFRANPQEFGPVIGRINQMLSRWGVSGPNVAEAEAELQSLLSLYGKSLSGAAISGLEFGRLMRALPQMYNRGDSFERLLQRFRTQVENDYRNTVEYFKKQGREVDQFNLRGAGGAELPLPGGFNAEEWERVE